MCRRGHDVGQDAPAVFTASPAADSRPSAVLAAGRRGGTLFASSASNSAWARPRTRHIRPGRDVRPSRRRAQQPGLRRLGPRTGPHHAGARTCAPASPASRVTFLTAPIVLCEYRISAIVSAPQMNFRAARNSAAFCRRRLVVTIVRPAWRPLGEAQHLACRVRRPTCDASSRCRPRSWSAPAFLLRSHDPLTTDPRFVDLFDDADHGGQRRFHRVVAVSATG